MAKRRLAVRALSLVLAAEAAAGCGSAAAHLQPIAASPAATIPIVACPTTHGDTTHDRARFPARTPTSLKPAVAAQLAYYTDDQRVVAPILAPRHWQCHAFDYVDGGRRIRVAPPGAPPGSVIAVVAEGDNACQGCDWALICRLMRTQAATLGYNMYNCPSPPAGERVTWLKGSPSDGGAGDEVVGFVDPPGVRGDGEPSGGVVTARGVLMYRKQPRVGDFASIDTCALPQIDRTLCSTILDDFEARSWGLS